MTEIVAAAPDDPVHGADRDATRSRRSVPTREQLGAWRWFLQAHARITRADPRTLGRISRRLVD